MIREPVPNKACFRHISKKPFVNGFHTKFVFSYSLQFLYFRKIPDAEHKLKDSFVFKNVNPDIL